MATRWDLLLGRRDLLKLGLAGGASLLVSGCDRFGGGGSKLLGDLPNGQNPFLAQFGPIDRTKGDESARVFTGDRFERPHSILWNLSSYLSQKQVEGPVEEVPLVVVGGGVAGLFTAFAHRKHRPILLEQAARFGGNAKGESWRGIDYSLGPAYIDYPHPGTPMRTHYDELGLEKVLVPRDTSDPVEVNGKLYTKFWDGETEPGQREPYRRMSELFANLNAEKERAFPFIPSLNSEHRESARHYDQWTLHELLTKTAGGKLPKNLEIALEHYCWSTYAASSAELSATAALNFLAQEANPIRVGAGGNSKIAETVLKRLIDEVGTDRLRAGCVVLSVQVTGDSVEVLYEDAQNKLRKIRAKAVVLSCPKFVAAKILKDVEPERLQTIQKLRYRSYMTANLLIKKKMPRTAYDVFMVGKGTTKIGETNRSHQEMNATDFILANFATPQAEGNVFTFYRAFPVDGARAELYQKGSYELYRQRFETQIERDILPLMGLKTEDIVDLRLTLWGHALPLAAKGVYRDETVDQLRKAHKERVFFVEQDNWVYPSLQTGATDAILLKKEVEKVL
jgi:protoporphyrinogen oxidase